MPELPEVETIRKDLSNLILNKKIVQVDVRVLKMVEPKNFAKKLEGLKIKKINRRGKLLIFELSDKSYLLIHLKMTGQLVYRNKDGKVGAVGGHPIKEDLQILPNKFTHVIFTFANKSHLFYNDVRKFGYLKIVEQKELNKISEKYGVEPFTSSFILENFTQVLKKKSKLKIKQLLLDQSLVSGLGNIYTDEACYYAGIRPMRAAGSLSKDEIKKLFKAIIKVLEIALEKRGTSTENYVDAYGRTGNMVPYLKVYGRSKEECKKCGTKLETLRISGRTSNYCPNCQK